jgi:hypothetical protein
MIHQLVFTKLLGELDYGAGTGIGDFNAAGCASRSDRQPRCTRAAAGRQQQGPGAGRNACVRRRMGPWRRRRRRRRRMQRRRRTGRGLQAMDALKCAAYRAGLRAAYRAGSRRRWLTGRVLVVCSYNSAGVWTWNTHSSDWIYQVRPQARVIAPRPRRSPQMRRSVGVRLRQRIRRRTHAGRALPSLHSTPNGLGARKGLVPVVHRRGFVSSAGESSKALD